MKAAACTLVLAIWLASCAHSPEQTFFALSAREGTALNTTPALKIELRRTALPGYLDRPHIVRRATAEQLELGGDERWGAPLDEMVGVTLAQDLAQRLPRCVVYTDGGAISAAPDVRVEVQLFRFERDAQGHVVLVAQVAVQTGSAHPSTTQRFTLSSEPRTGRTSDVVSGLSQLLGTLSDGIARMIAEQVATASAHHRQTSSPGLARMDR